MDEDLDDDKESEFGVDEGLDDGEENEFVEEFRKCYWCSLMYFILFF